MSTNRFLTLVSGIRTLVTAISTSAGAGDANKIVATSSDGRLDASLMPVGIGAATITVVASEALAAGDFVNIHDSTGTKVRKADSSNGRPAHGFVLAAVANAANATVYLQGVNTGLTSLTPGQLRFLGTAGASTATAPTTAGHLVQELGVCISTTGLNFEYNDYTQL
jgi:hypothetical protein